MPKPCRCDPPKPGPAEFVMNAGHCYVCWCWFYREERRVAWGGPVEPPKLPQGGLATQQQPKFSKASDRAKRRSLCHHLGTRQTQGKCKGNCNHECDLFDDREDVRKHLGDNRMSAVPNGTCQTCPGWEEQ